MSYDKSNVRRWTSWDVSLSHKKPLSLKSCVERVELPLTVPSLAVLADVIMSAAICSGQWGNSSFMLTSADVGGNQTVPDVPGRRCLLCRRLNIAQTIAYVDAVLLVKGSKVYTLAVRDVRPSIDPWKTCEKLDKNQRNIGRFVQPQSVIRLQSVWWTAGQLVAINDDWKWLRSVCWVWQ